MTPVTPYLIYLIFIATLGPFQFGFHLGELNAPQKAIVCQPLSGTSAPPSLHDGNLPKCLAISIAQWGLVQSIFTVGGLLGALSGGAVASRYGRVLTMKLLSVFLFVGPVLQTFAPSVLALMVGRFVSGVGAGAATVVCPMYIAEVSPTEKRGLFGAFTQVMINTGILVAQGLGYFLGHGRAWRFIFATSAAIALLTFVGLFAVPEGSSFTNAETRVEADSESATASGNEGSSGERSPLINTAKKTQAQVQYVEHSSPASSSSPTPALISSIDSTPTFYDIITTRRYRLAVIAVSITMMAQQLTGINSVMMYSVSTLSSIVPSSPSSSSSSTAALITVAVSFVNVFVTLIASPLSDRWGRRPCLLISAFGMGASSVLLALSLSLRLSMLSALGLLSFVCFFGVGLGPVPFILASELVNPELVGVVSSVALGWNWISTFLVAQFFPVLNQLLPGGKVYWLFAGSALVFGIAIAVVVPESQGRDVDEVWQD